MVWLIDDLLYTGGEYMPNRVEGYTNSTSSTGH
jgi:hypothetical protein